jgi:hypothetical protein
MPDQCGVAAIPKKNEVSGIRVSGWIDQASWFHPLTRVVLTSFGC